MIDEILCNLHGELVRADDMTDAGLAADVRETLSWLNLLVLPGPQPMETAPRDGTRILALITWDALTNYLGEVIRSAGAQWVAAVWDDGYRDGASFILADDLEEWVNGIDPVCWMPMPPIPDAATLRRIAKGAP